MTTLIRVILTLYLLVSLGGMPAWGQSRSLSRVSDLERRLEELIALDEQLALTLDQRDNDFQTFRTTVQGQITELQTQLSALRSESHTRDRRNANLQSVNTAQTRQIAEIQSRIATIRNEWQIQAPQTRDIEGLSESFRAQWAEVQSELRRLREESHSQEEQTQQRHREIEEQQATHARQMAELRRELTAMRKESRSHPQWQKELLMLRGVHDGQVADLQSQITLLRADARTQEHRHVMELARLRTTQRVSAQPKSQTILPQKVDAPRFATASDERVALARATALRLRGQTPANRTTAVYRAQR